VVAGEASGDLLGAGLIRSLKAVHPHLVIEGIGGPQMQEQGCVSLFPYDHLSLMGFEILTELPTLFRIRRRLVEHFCANPPDVFIGVDVPDFNLGLEEKLRKTGIRTVHYVSPTVWAWRRWRIHQIRRAVDLMLALFPFEARFYEAHNVRVEFVGHPLADLIPENIDTAGFRKKLGIPAMATVLALLPGSRKGELLRHADLFVQTAQRLFARHPRLHFVAPFVDQKTFLLFEEALQRHGALSLPVTRMVGHSRDLLAAADVALVASGTATLEAALLKKPMVVTYRVKWLSYWLGRLLIKIKLFSMPNNLAGREIVPELIQSDATVEKLTAALDRYLVSETARDETIRELAKIGAGLRRHADEQAARAVLSLITLKPE
jgi:lipid-A-disaccharide synthase